MGQSRRTRRWSAAVRQILSWIWALAPAWSLGFLTAPIMIGAAFRLRHWVQAVLAVLYSVATGVLLATAGAVDGSTMESVFRAALAVNLFVGLGNGIAVRRSLFFDRAVKEGLTGSGSGHPVPAPTGRDSQQAALAALGDTIELRRHARELADTQPAYAIELRIGRIDIHGRAFPDGGLIDVNNVPARAVAAEIPALAPYADRIETALGQVRAFGSSDDLSVTLGLPADLLDHAQERLIFLPRYEA